MITNPNISYYNRTDYITEQSCLLEHSRNSKGLHHQTPHKKPIGTTMKHQIDQLMANYIENPTHILSLTFLLNCVYFSETICSLKLIHLTNFIPQYHFLRKWQWLEA